MLHFLLLAALAAPPGAITPLVAPAHVEAKSASRLVIIEIEETRAGGARRVERVRLALEGRTASSIDLDQGDRAYELVVRSERDEGKSAVLQLSLETTRRDGDRQRRAQLSVRRRVRVGKPTLMTSLEGDERLRVTATLR